MSAFGCVLLKYLIIGLILPKAGDIVIFMNYATMRPMWIRRELHPDLLFVENGVLLIELRTRILKGVVSLTETISRLSKIQ